MKKIVVTDVQTRQTQKMNKCGHHGYDVTIVGAGPSGTILAYELASQGIKVLLLEKSKLPRYKACAGGIPLRTATLLPFNIQEAIEDVIYGFRLSYKFSNKVLKTHDKPLMYTVMRDKFDYLLARMAGDAGAIIRDEEKVEQVELSRDCAILKTNADTFSTRIVVGADGANSLVARSAGLVTDVGFGIGLQSEVYIDEEHLMQWDGVFGMDAGGIQGGFGWIFPKKSHISVGAGGPVRAARKLKPYLFRLLESLDIGNYKILSLKSHLLPSREKGTPIVSRRVLLLGDAAGLVDAFTGEGIYGGIRSAQLAAPAIIKALETGIPALGEYEMAVDKELMPALEAAQKLARLVNWGSRPIFNLVKDNEIIWREACRLSRGERAYPTFEGTRAFLAAKLRRSYLRLQLPALRKWNFTN